MFRFLKANISQICIRDRVEGSVADFRNLRGLVEARLDD